MELGRPILPIAMTTSNRRISRYWKRRTQWAHRFLTGSEAGVETLQVVMLLAIAAVCLITIRQWWVPISAYFRALIELLIQN
jgi:hypothetical protein